MTRNHTVMFLQEQRPVLDKAHAELAHREGEPYRKGDAIAQICEEWLEAQDNE